LVHADIEALGFLVYEVSNQFQISVSPKHGVLRTQNEMNSFARGERASGFALSKTELSTVGCEVVIDKFQLNSCSHGSEATLLSTVGQYLIDDITRYFRDSAEPRLPMLLLPRRSERAPLLSHSTTAPRGLAVCLINWGLARFTLARTEKPRSTLY